MRGLYGACRRSALVGIESSDLAIRSLAGQGSSRRRGEIIDPAQSLHASTAVNFGERDAVAAGPEGAELAVPTEPARVLDSTGAGDASDAGLIVTLDDGAD